MRLTKLYAIITLFLFTLVCRGPAYALDLDDVNDKTDEELSEEDWETRYVKSSSGNMKCGLLSIIVSPFWRGYGHHCIGDKESNYKLLTMEGVSLGMLATSLLIGSLSHDDKKLSGLWKSLFHFGTTLFLASYLFDVFGAFKGDSFSFANNHLDPYGNTTHFKLRWIPSTKFQFGLEAAYSYRNPRFWVSPYGRIAIHPVSDYQLGFDTGVALWYAERTHTYVAVAVNGEFNHSINDDYHTIKILPYIEFSLDLGTWLDHLAEFRFINRLGVGVNLYHFEYALNNNFEDHDTLLVLESGISLNVLQNFNIEFIYRYRDDYVVGPISAPSWIKNTVPVPGVGIFSLDLSFNISSSWQIEADANFGKKFDFWVGVNNHF